MTIHHLQIWVPDMGRTERSWGWLLGELGYEVTRSWERGRVWRKGPTGIVLESSPDMVPGMLYSRLRPGLNHVAFHVDTVELIESIASEASAHGWSNVGHDVLHPIGAQFTATYLEDSDGFEVELISPSP